MIVMGAKWHANDLPTPRIAAATFLEQVYEYLKTTYGLTKNPAEGKTMTLEEFMAEAERLVEAELDEFVSD